MQKRALRLQTFHVGNKGSLQNLGRTSYERETIKAVNVKTKRLVYKKTGGSWRRGRESLDSECTTWKLFHLRSKGLLKDYSRSDSRRIRGKVKVSMQTFAMSRKGRSTPRWGRNDLSQEGEHSGRLRRAGRESWIEIMP